MQLCKNADKKGGHHENNNISSKAHTKIKFDFFFIRTYQVIQNVFIYKSATFNKNWSMDEHTVGSSIMCG